jgi:Uma2 family endonuclease
MAATTNLLSWEAFEKLPDDGMHHEIIEGELQTLPPPKSGHSKIAKKVFLALHAIEGRANVEVFLEAGYKLSASRATWIQPDVSVIRKARAVSSSSDGYFPGAPELAVEVVSPSESAHDLDRKVELLLSHGSQAVWVIYPKTRKVHVHQADGQSFNRTMHDTLSLEALLDNWSLPVASIFEDTNQSR